MRARTPPAHSSCLGDIGGVFAVLLLATSTASAADVVIEGFAFTPSDLTVYAGTTVHWENRDSSEHTVTSQTGPGTLVPNGVFDSDLLTPGQSFRYRFAAPGVYDYFCVPHGSSMQGVVRVLPRCPADVDDGSGTGRPDGGVTIDDLLHYLSLFDRGVIAADVDDGTGLGVPDGGVTIDDLLYFLARFDAGC